MFFILNKISFPTKSLVQKLNWWRQLIYGESDLFHVGRILMIAFQCNSNVLRKKIICLACTFVFCGNFDNSHYKPSLKRFRFFSLTMSKFYNVIQKTNLILYVVSMNCNKRDQQKLYFNNIFFNFRKKEFRKQLPWKSCWIA